MKKIEIHIGCLYQLNEIFLDFPFENKQQILRTKSGFVVSELVAESSKQNIEVSILFEVKKQLFVIFPQACCPWGLDEFQ